MDWTQTFTIILTIIGSTAAVWYAFYHIVKEDIKETKQEFVLFRQETREEFSKVHALWANLLEKICNIEKQIFEIKLDQSRKK